MTLATLIRAGGLAEIMRTKAPANANAANFANDRAGGGPPLATLAPLALANPQGELTDTRPAHDTEPVTVPALTEAERQAIEYAERVAAIREQGKVPGSYTATTFCEQCGPVFIFECAPPRVTACPWCHNRARDLPIPHPPVTCASCRHWRRDLAEPYALVTCAHAKARYPGEQKPCAYFQPSEDKQ